ncbi:hypothetical protein P170DRAFT_127409 [Aspergillus steynii IBT 23096]|uniref:Uncharacterized protein n=1 Tax=Aspergillus steynii IBT 23096 TaxID=1392250 RepID=A0A2I2GK59_9EURO|nr:uncharacterized protein P170DRAFT_127409 [Aspergillus steynii IBT 23096]PLB53264.1 hypothetical protein P170DRAFT_127409 [Aspergillus steynii IBT 23096]
MSPGWSAMSLTYSFPLEFSFHGEFPMTQSFADALSKHKRSPQLHLLGEQGRTQVTKEMSFVCALHTRVDAHAYPHRPPRATRRYVRPWDLEPETLNLHELFTAYPNLESLSVSINRFKGGCVVGGPPSPIPSDAVHEPNLSASAKSISKWLLYPRRGAPLEGKVSLAQAAVPQPGQPGLSGLLGPGEGPCTWVDTFHYNQ